MPKPPVLLEPDSRWQLLIGTIQDLEAKAAEWVVAEEVPEPIGKILAVARDLFVYGYFKYEFHFVSLVWSLFALEASLRDLLKANEGTKFVKLISQGVERGLIADHQKEFLDAGRTLRNQVAHPTEQVVITPAMAAETLRSTHQLISEMYQQRASTP